MIQNNFKKRKTIRELKDKINRLTAELSHCECTIGTFRIGMRQWPRYPLIGPDKKEDYAVIMGRPPVTFIKSEKIGNEIVEIHYHRHKLDWNRCELCIYIYDKTIHRQSLIDDDYESCNYCGDRLEIYDTSAGICNRCINEKENEV